MPVPMHKWKPLPFHQLLISNFLSETSELSSPGKEDCLVFIEEDFDLTVLLCMDDGLDVKTLLVHVNVIPTLWGYKVL